MNVRLTEENVTRIKSGITISECKYPRKHNVCEKDCIWNAATCSCENGKYVAVLLMIQWLRVMKSKILQKVLSPKPFQQIVSQRIFISHLPFY